MQKIITNFYGLDQSFDSSKIAEGFHPLITNARVRDNVVSPITCPAEDMGGIPSGALIQGIYTAQNLSVIFADGKAYYRDYAAPLTDYTIIPDFQMSETAPRLWAELVPASSLNYVRVSSDGTPSGTITLTSPANQTPAALVVQDNINQPWVIFPDGTARETQAFGDWTPDNREYVPIGNMMLFNGVTLYVVSQDYKRILRSVSGRPLDFIIAIDNTGNKLSEEAGDADAVSHAVSFNEITCIAPLSLPDGEFYVGSGNVSHIVKPDLNDTLFNEPRFQNQFLFSTAALNDLSFIELTGDFKFIDRDGLRSFNAVLQAQNEGKNLPFSKQIHPLLKGIVQDVTCAIKFDNYGYFAVNTIHGAGVLVWDELLGQYSSLDIYTGVSLIKQFAEIKVGNNRDLLFITDENKVYKHEGTMQEVPGILIGKYEAQQFDAVHRLQLLSLVFSNVKEAGTVTASSYVDDKLVSTRTKTFAFTTLTDSSPVPLPLDNPSVKKVKKFTLNFIDSSEQGLYVGAWITWNFSADLNKIYLSTVEDIGIQHEDEAEEYCNNVESTV